MRAALLSCWALFDLLLLQNHVLRDDWTVVSNDLSLCAQFEHTLLVTDDGVDVLTAYEPFAEVEE